MNTDPILFAGRILLSAMYAISAIDKFRGNKEELEMIRSLHLPVPEMIEAATGVFEILCVICLVVGFEVRAAALMLIAFTLFVSLVFLRFWSFTGPLPVKLGMRNAFFGNLSAVGGLLILLASGAGSWAIASS